MNRMSMRKHDAKRHPELAVPRLTLGSALGYVERAEWVTSWVRQAHHDVFLNPHSPTTVCLMPPISA